MISLFHTKPSLHEKQIVADVLDSGIFVMGRNVERLERELSDYLLAPDNVVTCASGTDALTLVLEQTGCRGRGVIVPAMTFSATYEAVLRAGATPILCDVDPETLTPSAEQIRSTMTDAIYVGVPVGAVIIVHLYGWPAYDTEEIAEWSKAQNLLCIEDCAQAFGARVNGKPVGTFADAAAFSFYPTKPLGGIGDGGAAYFSRPRDVEQARARRNHGRMNGVQVMAGYNSRLDEINAAILRHRLANYDPVIEYRLELASRYDVCGMRKMSIKRAGTGAPYVYPVMVTEREKMMARLATIGIESRAHYSPAVSGLSYVNFPCPNTDWASRHILSLPCHQGMGLKDVDLIADIIRA